LKERKKKEKFCCIFSYSALFLEFSTRKTQKRKKLSINATVPGPYPKVNIFPHLRNFPHFTKKRQYKYVDT
jgi:hypothetical protein